MLSAVSFQPVPAEPDSSDYVKAPIDPGLTERALRTILVNSKRLVGRGGYDLDSLAHL